MYTCMELHAIVQNISLKQGLLSCHKVVRGHAMYVDNGILNVTLNFDKKQYSHESCVDDLSACSFQDLTKNGGLLGSS